MIAYKFLAKGALGPFTGFRWPTDGRWVRAIAPQDGAGIHACRPADLPYWIDEELWRLELSDPVTIHGTQVEGRRGRLLCPIAAWDRLLCREFAAACAFRTRDLAVEALGEACAPAQELLGARDLPALLAAARGASGLPPFQAEMVAYVADASFRALEGNAGSSSHTAAVAAVALGGSESAFAEERAWQAKWLAERLALDG
jgi:hypothetical protein